MVALPSLSGIDEFLFSLSRRFQPQNHVPFGTAVDRSRPASRSTYVPCSICFPRSFSTYLSSFSTLLACSHRAERTLSWLVVLLRPLAERPSDRHDKRQPMGPPVVRSRPCSLESPSFRPVRPPFACGLDPYRSAAREACARKTPKHVRNGCLADLPSTQGQRSTRSFGWIRHKRREEKGGVPAREAAVGSEREKGGIQVRKREEGRIGGVNAPLAGRTGRSK